MTEQDVYGVIYVIENKVNGKKYVGQTVQGLKKRFSQHVTSSRRKRSGAIHYALEKYGKDNFEIREVTQSMSREELDSQEVYWIEKMNALSPKGYNLTKGGYGSSGYRHSGRAKKSMSEKRKGSKNSSARAVINLDTLKVYGTLVEASESLGLETTNNIYKSCRGLGSYDYNFAYYDDYINNTVPPRGKKMGTPTTKVINLDTKEIFNSLAEACIKHNLESSNLTKACSNQINGTGGYNWAYYNDYLKGNYTIKKVQQKRPIINLDTLEVFETSVEAGEKHHTQRSNITYCCQGKRNKAGGYRWQYYEDYLEEKDRRGALNGD